MIEALKWYFAATPFAVALMLIMVARSRGDVSVGPWSPAVKALGFGFAPGALAWSAFALQYAAARW